MLEIERKFLINTELLSIPSDCVKEYITQWYSASDDLSSGRCERVRESLNTDTGKQTFTHTVKERVDDTTRHEYEVELTPEQFSSMLAESQSWYKLKKLRFTFITEGNAVPWELDIFQGDNDGLHIAEIELSDPNDLIVFPKWISDEITSDLRYTNVQLARVPYTKF